MNIEIAPKEYERKLNWDEANIYCSELIIDDKNDWRLPTKEELNYIFNSENDFVGSYYWSSTESSSRNYAWLQDMLYGNQDDYGKHNFEHVRAVRDL